MKKNQFHVIVIVLGMMVAMAHRADGQFTAADIGNPALSGSTAPASGGFNLTGAGGDIGGTNDQFHFNYQSYAGDFDVKVRVDALSLGDAWAKAGLMARENLTVGSRYAAGFATPGVSGSFFQFRFATAGQTTNTGSFPATYPNMWLRLKRAGNAFTGYASVDGDAWSLLGSITMAPAAAGTMLVGMAVTSHATNQSVVGQFRDFGDVTGSPATASPALPREPIGASSRRTGLVISEIMYHPRTIGGLTNRSLEFVEIYNSQAFDERIAGYRISGSVDYIFPANTVLSAGKYLVVARDPAFVQTHYNISGVLGPWDGVATNVIGNETIIASTNSLPGGSGTVRLRNRQGAVQLEVNYLGGNPWPIAADGAGHSLVLNRPSYGEGDPRAWSASDTLDGSPGRDEPFGADPVRNVVINEFLAHTGPTSGLEDYIELYNHGNQPIDLSDAILTDEGDTNKFRIPSGTVLAPRGFISFTETTLGFSLSADGERIFLINSNATRVLDAVAFDAQADGRSSGRVPDGAPTFYPLAARTPGAANGPRWQSPVVINELMYSPISGNSADEYIELYNRSTNTVDLSKWRLADGISFNFASNTLIAPDGYLVIANNLANLLAHYPGVLSSANTVGNYKGGLANGGERVELLMPNLHITTNGAGQFVTNTLHVLACDVTYSDGGRWGDWSDGGGSSLELVDANADTRQPASWADSDETAKGQWTNVEFTGPLGESLGSPINDRLLIFVLGIGECLVDEVEVHNGAGPNLVLNGGFENGLTSWVPQGSHDFSTIENVGFAGTKSLHVRAASRGDNGANRIRTDGTAFLVTSPVTLRAKVRWLRGWPEILLRVRGGTAEAVGRMQIPLNLGTPGQRNSQARSNIGPAIFDVVHSPILPQAGEPVVVTAKATDPDGLGTLTLRYRVDAGNTNVTPALFTSAAMVDDGTSGDAIAGDGVYSATIPGRSAGAIVTFYLQAVDSLGATNLFPQDVFPQPGFDRCFPNDAPTRECVVRWGEVQMTGSFATYHLWLSYATSNRWAYRGRPTTIDGGLDNAQLDGTFVYNNSRVVYNALPLYAGSPWHRGAMQTGPCGTNRVDFVMNFPVDDRMLGNTDFVLNNPGNPGTPNAFSTSDGSAQTEQTSYIIFNEIGLVYNHRRYVHHFVNGSQRSTTADRPGNFIFEDSQQPNSDMIAEWFPDDTGGELYKIEDWFEFPDNGYDFSNNNDADLIRRTILLNNQPTLVITPYRFMFRKRSVGPGEGTADYSSFFAVVNAVSPASNPNSTTVDANAVGSVIDYEQWMRIVAVQHAIGNWDSYGYRRGKNDYTYKPVNGTFQQMTWDIDFTMGVGGDGTTQDIFDTNDPRMTAMWQTPAIVRAYWRAFLDIVNGPMNNAFMDPILDAKQAALLANNVNVNTGVIGTIKTYIAGRRANLLNLLASVTPGFSVSGASSFETSSNLLVLTGGASVAVKDISVNGVIYPVTWSGGRNSATNWTIRLALSSGTNQLVVQGLDAKGNVVAGTSRALTVNYTGSSASPQDGIVFNEIMYNPTVPDASYVEFYNRNPGFSFDVSGWRVNGLDFTFPVGTVLGSGQYMVIAKNRGAFLAAYGAVPVTGQFDGNLDMDGETLTLIKPGTTNTPDVVIDKVRYEARLPWSRTLIGTSLQLVDNAQDNSRSSAWSAQPGGGPQPAPSPWVHVTREGNLQLGTNLFFWLTTAGSCYIDDISLTQTNPGSPNIVLNGDFEDGTTVPWILGTNYAGSTVVNNVSHSGSRSLLVRGGAPSSGGSLPATVQQFISTNANYVPNAVYTLSYWIAISSNVTTLTMRTLPGSALQVGGTNFVPTPPPTPVLASPGSNNVAVATNLPPYDAVWVNELQANNTTGPLDNTGEHDPWIELYNGGTNTVDLSGYYLANNYDTNLTQWPFPGGTTIAPREFKIIWADGEPGETAGTNLHTSFRLNSSTGSVALVRFANGQPQITDYLTYGPLAANQSYGDFPDGQPFNRLILREPTPRGTNTARFVNVFINEWLASNTTNSAFADPADGQFEDWFELYNAGTEAVDLGGFFLTDSTSSNTNNYYRVPSNGQYVIPAGGFLLVWADNEPEQNGPDRPDLHVDFALGKGGERIILYGPDGRSLIDRIDFDAQTDDVSEGRFPDGTPNITVMGRTTPRQSNVLTAGNSAPVIAAIGTKTATLGQPFSFTIIATDAQVSQTLTYSILSGAPSGATLDANSGLFSWNSAFSWTPGTNHVTVQVTDNGAPPLSDSETFTLIGLPPAPTLTVNGNQVTIGFQTIAGKTYRVEFKDDLNAAQWQRLNNQDYLAAGASLVVQDSLNGNPQRFYRIVQLD